MPYKVHFYWFAKDPTTGIFDESLSVCLTSFRKYHPEYPIVFHTNLTNVDDFGVIDEMRVEELIPCPHPKTKGVWTSIQHGVDYKRICDAYEEGGIFLDVDFTFIRRIPDEFLNPSDNKIVAYNIYDGWHPSFCIASFTVPVIHSNFLKRWKDWYTKDYNNVDYNWNGNFIGGLVENYCPGETKHLGTKPLYDYVCAGKMDWSFKEYYFHPEKQKVAALHWGCGYIISCKKDECNAWTSAKHFVETGGFLDDFIPIGKTFNENDLAEPDLCYRFHLYVVDPNFLNKELLIYIQEALTRYQNMTIHYPDKEEFKNFCSTVHLSNNMNISECFEKYGGIHLNYNDVLRKGN